MCGQMDVATRVSGRITTCMAKAFIPGRMGGDMKENMQMTESMDMESTLGLMADSMSASGKTENNMEKEPINKQTAQKKEAFGRMEKESSGWIDRF
jgi:hypothetical protein